jgi:hypothetical protein
MGRLPREAKRLPCSWPFGLDVKRTSASKQHRSVMYAGQDEMESWQSTFFSIAEKIEIRGSGAFDISVSLTHEAKERPVHGDSGQSFGGQIEHVREVNTEKKEKQSCHASWGRPCKDGPTSR